MIQLLELSPAYLLALVEWAEARVMIFVLGPDESMETRHRRDLNG